MCLCVAPPWHRGSYVQLPEREARKKAAAPKSMPFTGTTSYGDIGDMEFPIDDDGGDMAKYRPPAGESLPFEGESEAQRAFPGHNASKTRKPVKARSHGIGVGEGEFKGDTEAREAYPGHKVFSYMHGLSPAMCTFPCLCVGAASAAVCPCSR